MGYARAVIGRALDGRYQILRVLGKGGMGVVYEAQHAITGRRVAVKLLNAAAAQNEDSFARFQRELRVAGTLDTPHVAQVLDAGHDPETGSLYMVMELLSGEDLGQTVKRLGALPPDVALRIMAQACIGLAAAHAVGVVHRDVKPANIFLSKRDGGEIIVKIVDFGIAKLITPDVATSAHSQETRTGSIMGTPHYMSPEQAKGIKNIDHRADIWSMGAVLYRLLTNRTPHADVDTLGQLILAICTAEPRPLQEFAPWVSPEVAAIAHGALRIDPNRRFPNVVAMLDAVKALLPGGSSALHEGMLVPLVEHVGLRDAYGALRPKPPSPAERAMSASPARAAGATVSGISLETGLLMTASDTVAPVPGFVEPNGVPAVGRRKWKIVAMAAGVVLSTVVLCFFFLWRRTSANPPMTEAHPGQAGSVAPAAPVIETNPPPVIDAIATTSAAPAPSGSASAAARPLTQKKAPTRLPQGGSVWDRQ